MRMFRTFPVGGACLMAVAAGSPADAQDRSLTLCWAAWDPANALVELSKNFTAKSGIAMKFEFVPCASRIAISPHAMIFFAADGRRLAT